MNDIARRQVEARFKQLRKMRGRRFAVSDSQIDIRSLSDEFEKQDARIYVEIAMIAQVLVATR